ncbi:MAG: site-specific DNA-methyltransferase [Chlorobium phaeovibrioides]|nr:site-specific DNA-methyltransferase [Chlorobium phaeovibrioides]
MEKMDGKTMDIVAENVGKLKELFPEAFTEGKVDFEALKEVLGTFVDDRDERYSFTWNGKSKARMIAQTPSTGTLRPCKEESVNWDTTQNIFVEGDNLEVLKLLQKSYHKKVKMIYIDPPYNTGEDFVYEDNFRDNIKNYLALSGQVDGEGKKIASNPETSGRYHTDWLNMMYPRLKLARNLLNDEGVMFISIGDAEVSNLKKLCDEIFGEENFEGIIHWRRRHNQPNDPTKMIGLVAEHILAYAKDKVRFKDAGCGKIGLTGSFTNPDNDPRGDWASKPWKVGSDQSGSRYTITTPTGVVLDEDWMGEESTFKSLLEDNRIIFPNNGNGAPRKKYYKSERENEGQCATNWWTHDQFGHNQEGNTILTELMDGIKNTFSNPKPPKLIKNLLSIANCKDGDLALDFFLGSATTFHAGFDYDANLRIIGIQFPEILYAEKKEHKPSIEFCENNSLPLTIAEISKERIRRTAAKIKEENPGYNGDLGFKVFKLDSTNIKPWEVDFDLTAEGLFDYVENIKTDRREEDVLYEILLKYGLDLTLPISEHAIAGQKVFNIGMGALIICLADAISLDVVEGMAKLKEELNPEIMRVVFKDSGFKDDVVKTNAVQILKQAGIIDVRSL